MGTSSPPQKGGRALSPIFGPCLLWPNSWMDQDGTWHGGQFPAHFYCSQTAGCIKMPLGMGLSPGDFVFDGEPATHRKKGTPTPPNFGLCLLWPNGLMDEDATWYGSRPRPRPRCIRRGPCYPRKGHSSPPSFGPCLLWPRSPISATAELLFCLWFRALD